MATSFESQENALSQLEPVLQLARRGWRLFPCVSHDKRPLIQNWQYCASSDSTKLHAWAKKYGDCNWAVACGAGSGIWVLDVDGTKGHKSLLSLIERHGGDWVSTLKAKTARGYHLYFRCSLSENIATTASKVGDHIDSRGHGGYVIVPPSVHPSGVRYEWFDAQNVVAEAPSWLSEVVRRKPTALAFATHQLSFNPTVLEEGCRNNGLTKIAGSLRRRGASLSQIEGALIAHNKQWCRPPLSEHEVLSIANSVARYRPGGLDPLEVAWLATANKEYESGYQHFLDLCRQLQQSCGHSPIALPLKKISGLFHCDWTQVRRWRQRAVRRGGLDPYEPHIPRRRAARFFFQDRGGGKLSKECQEVTRV